MCGLKSCLGSAFRVFFTFCIFRHEKSVNVSAIFALLARLSVSAPLLHYPPAKAMKVSAKITPGAGLASSPSLGGVWPSIKCLLVSKKHVFYEFSRFRSAFEKNTYFTELSRPSVGCATGANRPEGRFSPRHWWFFQREREAEHCFFDLQRSYFHRKIQWFSYFVSEVEDRFVRPVKYVPLGHQRAR